jgi:thymidylate synthase
MRSTRVQQNTGLELTARERLGYQYSILNMTEDMDELMEIGKKYLPFYREYEKDIREWLSDEMHRRLTPAHYFNASSNREDPDYSEILHPFLRKTLEGNAPSYTYQQRLQGAAVHHVRALKKNPDTRRAFWPIYRGLDGTRMSDPTRIPCSLGYQPIIRDLGDGTQKLNMFYLERSCDYDRFWLTDVFLASKYQSMIAQRLDVPKGSLIHYIISFHSFTVDNEEIY